MKNKRSITLGILPALSIYAIFSIFPIIVSIYYSFFKWDGFTDKIFIGLNNYSTIINDPSFWNSAKNNILVVLASVFGQLSIALVLALLFNSKLRGTKFFRTMSFVPVILSTVVVSVIWKLMYHPSMGLINNILAGIGLEKLTLNWLGKEESAMGAILLVIIWQYIGFYVMIFLAAIQNIPNSIYESAELDGATWIQKIVNITIPMIWPTIITTIILCISGSLKTFDLIYVMTKGGPANSTEVMSIYAYNNTFSAMKYGYGSAASVLILTFSLALILIAKLLLEKKKDVGV